MTTASTWHEIERDDRYRISFIVYRCRSCKRLGVSSGGHAMSPCICTTKR